MDNIFLLTIGFIFLGALFSNVMKWRNKDKVLKDLQGFQTTFEMQDGKHIWGKTQVYTNGLELYFSKAAKNATGDAINSYVFFRDDIDNIRLIYRNHSELSKDSQQLREKEVARVSSPSFWHRFKRNMRIFFNMFNDAIGEALNVFLSRMKGAGSSAVLTTQSDYLKKMGTTALSAVGNAYDPILERYVNHRVVVALKEDDNYQEYCGYLKEYSSAWMSLLDCKVTRVREVDLDDLSRLTLQRDLDFCYQLKLDSKGCLVLAVGIKYFGTEKVKLLLVKGGDDDKAVTETTKSYQHKINKTLMQGESIKFTLKNLPEADMQGLDLELLPLKFEMISEERQPAISSTQHNHQYQTILPELKLVLESTYITDLYMPRTLAVLRHGAD